MSKIKHIRKISSHLNAVINDSVEAAVASRVAEAEEDLYRRLTVAFHNNGKVENVTPIRVEKPHRMCNPEAGP